MDVITFPDNLQTTSGLWIFLHGVISLLDAVSYDKKCLHHPVQAEKFLILI